MTTPDTDAAIETVNAHLMIDAVRTRRGDEVKFWTEHEEGGRDDAYLSAKDCAELANAFGVLAAALAQDPVLP